MKRAIITCVEVGPSEGGHYALDGFPSALGAFELAHEFHECVDTRFWKRVVDRRAHAANRSMTFQAVESFRYRSRHECLLELLARQPERDVHQRAAVDRRRASVEAGAIDFRVELGRLA